eukprot:1003476-Pleurochrysis_carterae.AAC.2
MPCAACVRTHAIRARPCDRNRAFTPSFFTPCSRAPGDGRKRKRRFVRDLVERVPRLAVLENGVRGSTRRARSRVPTDGDASGFAKLPLGLRRLAPAAR